jgi:two-component system, sensor histidine kinase and response regulator
MKGAKGTILVVDDSPETLRVMCSFLKELGYSPRPAPSGSVALEFARTQPPDLVLLDVAMEAMDGFDTCRALKKLPRMAQVPILFVTIMDETFNKIEAFGIGAVDYITKPVHMEELAARVENHLRLSQLRRNLELRNHELSERTAQLEKLRRQQDAYTHMVVHDLRSPLAGLELNLSVIDSLAARSNLNGEVRFLLGEMQAGLGRARELVDTVLLVNRLETATPDLTIGVADIAKLAQEIVDNSPWLRRHVVSVRPSTADTAVCDVSLVRRVIENLLSNASRYTPQGKMIAIGINQTAASIVVSVDDEGPGIPLDRRQVVFEKFHRAMSGQGDGFGLGLFFCKLAVEAHKGQIWIENGRLGGARFCFTLPASTPSTSSHH